MDGWSSATLVHPGQFYSTVLSIFLVIMVPKSPGSSVGIEPEEAQRASVASSPALSTTSRLAL